MKNKKRHIVRTVVIAVIAVAAAGTGIGWEWSRNQGETSDLSAYKTETVRRGNVTSGISENGTVEFGTTEQTFSVAEITEVSLSSGNSSDSTSDLSSGASGTFASFPLQGGMNNGMSIGADPAAESRQSETSSSSSSSSDVSLIVEEVYPAAGQVIAEGDKILKITDDSISNYRTQLQAAIKSAQLSVKQEEINVESKKSEAEYTYQMYLAEGETAEETYQATITSLKNAVTDLEEELEEAREDVDTYQSYVDWGYDYSEELEEAQSNYSTIESNLQIAKNNLTTKSLEAKQTYETSMTNYKYADQLYEIDTDGLEDDLEDARETLQDAEDALDDFDEQIGDGFVYAEYSGTIMEVAYASGDSIVNDAVMVSYTDSDNVTMTVSVSQEDISNVAVGEAVSVNLTAYPNEEFTGTVSSIAATSSTGSSTVNYDVVVLFQGDVSKVYSGMTGEAVFAGKNITDTLYISNKAVNLEGARSWVKVLKEDGIICETDITTGYSNGTVVAVESGLEEGDTVLIESKVGS